MIRFLRDCFDAWRFKRFFDAERARSWRRLKMRQIEDDAMKGDLDKLKEHYRDLRTMYDLERRIDQMLENYKRTQQDTTSRADLLFADFVHGRGRFAMPVDKKKEEE